MEYKSRPNLHIATTALVFIIVSMLTDHIQAALVSVTPDRSILNEGQPVSLLCKYNKPINYCRIEIPGEKVLNLSPEWNKTPGFSYHGSGLQNGECGVTIDRASASHNGKVKCSLGVEGEEYDGLIELVVALRPQQPIIEFLSKPDRDDTFAADSLFVARCIVSDGRPAANISWFIDDMPIVHGLSVPEVIDTQNDRNVTLWTTRQQIQKYLTPEDDGKMLICRADHQTDMGHPQEGKFLLKVRYSPVPQPDATVYGLYLERTAKVNITIRANPTPITEWTIEGVAIPQGTQNGRYSAYEPYNLGNGYYNVTLAIAGLTLEDTTKTYYLKASNGLGVRDYTVRISSSSTPPSEGLDIGSIVGIAVAVAVLVIIVLLIVFARATGRWCFGAKSSKTPTNETSDTESADIKTETKSHAAKSQRLPSFSSLFMRRNEKSKKDSTLAADQTGATTATTTTDEDEQNLGESNRAMTASTGEDGIKIPEGSATGSDNKPKEDKQLVYAELVLKPSDNQPIPSKNSTEYAEIVYVQKPTPSGTTTESKVKI